MKTVIKVERGNRKQGDYQSLSVVYRKTALGWKYAVQSSSVVYRETDLGWTYTVQLGLAEQANYEEESEALEHFEILKTAKGF